MELARLHDLSEKPFQEVRSVALAITGTVEQRHIGIIYRDDEVSNGGTELLELAWHHFVRSTPAGSVKDRYFWVEPEIPRPRARVMARFCRMLARKYVNRRPSLAYALSYSGGTFDPENGSFLTQDGLGLTCATFVLAVFASRGLLLIRTEEWIPREEDRLWQLQIIERLRNHRDPAHRAIPEHIAAVERELGCARFRPEEVAAAGTSTELPTGFEYAERVGKKIVARIASQPDPL